MLIVQCINTVELRLSVNKNSDCQVLDPIQPVCASPQDPQLPEPQKQGKGTKAMK